MIKDALIRDGGIVDREMRPLSTRRRFRLSGPLPPRSGSSGSVLVLSLWVLSLLSLVALGLGVRAGLEARLRDYAWDEIRLVQAARMGQALCVAAMNSFQDLPAHSAVNQPWSQNPELFRDRPVEGGFVTLRHGRGGDVFYGMEDESARVNLNTAPPEILERLFAFSPEAVTALKPWWRPDAPREEAEEGAEERRVPARGSLRQVEEFLLVPGATPWVFRQVEDFITVHGNGRVNVNTADPRVLEAVGLSPSLSLKVDAYRRGEDREWGNEDDRAFADLEDLVPLLRDASPVSDEEALSFEQARGQLSVDSRAFRLNMTARLEDGRSERSFTLILSRAPQYPLVSWKERGR